ncbi:zinc finger protein 84-like [Trichogramma pretiosum]|uniref:zinc finger protein 84-like n=1 Tax=Trichogramma pretiosum TaxID=7493 RepID=UPI000C71AA6B|nr:zinc finger protein 84-like [Trichogramma pretiosum]
MSLTLYPCERCQDYFSSEYALAHHHRYNHTSEPDLRCSDGIELESHAALTETSSHEPNLCRESQMEIDCFDQASVIEGSRTKYVCKMCHEVFITESLLTSHQKLVHLELLVHVCAVCHEVFPERHALISHKEHCDSGNNYECNVCHEAFPLQRLLTNHEKLSHPERSFKRRKLDTTQK